MDTINENSLLFEIETTSEINILIQESTVTHTPIDGFPYQRTCPMQPPAEYGALRAEQPISQVTLASGRKAWLLTKYEDIRQMLTSSNVSSNMAHPGYPLHFNAPAEVLEQMRPVMLAMDPPVHTVQRKMVLAEFTNKQAARLRPRIQEIVTAQIEALKSLNGPVDLVENFAIPIPSLVICELLGVPFSDRSDFQKHTRNLVSIEADPEERENSHQELRTYFSDLLDLKKSDPADDLLSRLIDRNDRSETLSREEMIGLANVLLVGGHETTANMIALGIVALLENEDQLNIFKSRPSIRPQAIDELLRFFSIADQVTSRVAIADFYIGGSKINAGDGIIGLSASANHDEAIFNDPQSLNFEREAKPHMAFGRGIHQCIGQNLAKIELETALVSIFEQIPKLRLAHPANELPFKDNRGVYGLHRLPAVW